MMRWALEKCGWQEVKVSQAAVAGVSAGLPGVGLRTLKSVGSTTCWPGMVPSSVSGCSRAAVGAQCRNAAVSSVVVLVGSTV